MKRDRWLPISIQLREGGLGLLDGPALELSGVEKDADRVALHGQREPARLRPVREELRLADAAIEGACNLLPTADLHRVTPDSILVGVQAEYLSRNSLAASPSDRVRLRDEMNDEVSVREERRGAGIQPAATMTCACCGRSAPRPQPGALPLGWLVQINPHVEVTCSIDCMLQRAWPN